MKVLFMLNHTVDPAFTVSAAWAWNALSESAIARTSLLYIIFRRQIKMLQFNASFEDDGYDCATYNCDSFFVQGRHSISCDSNLCLCNTNNSNISNNDHKTKTLDLTRPHQTLKAHCHVIMSVEFTRNVSTLARPKLPCCFCKKKHYSLLTCLTPQTGTVCN